MQRGCDLLTLPLKIKRSQPRCTRQLLPGYVLPAEDFAAVGGAGGGELFRRDIHQLGQRRTNRRQMRRAVALAGEHGGGHVR